LERVRLKEGSTINITAKTCIFDTIAKTGGAETFIVEMEMNTFKESASYIESIQEA
jgi:hypothetical protein